MIIKIHDMLNYNWQNVWRYYDNQDRTKPLKVVACYISEKRMRETPYYKGRFWVLEFEDGRKRYEDSYGNGANDLK